MAKLLLQQKTYSRLDKIGLLGLLVTKHVLFARSSIFPCRMNCQGGKSRSCEMQAMDVRQKYLQDVNVDRMLVLSIFGVPLVCMQGKSNDEYVF